MEYACEVCGAAVHVVGGAGETRCAGCEAPNDPEEKDGHAERRALRRLLRDSHEKGRGTPAGATDED